MGACITLARCLPDFSGESDIYYMQCISRMTRFSLVHVCTFLVRCKRQIRIPNVGDFVA